MSMDVFPCRLKSWDSNLSCIEKQQNIFHSDILKEIHEYCFHILSDLKDEDFKAIFWQKWQLQSSKCYYSTVHISPKKASENYFIVNWFSFRNDSKSNSSFFGHCNLSVNDKWIEATLLTFLADIFVVHLLHRIAASNQSNQLFSMSVRFPKPNWLGYKERRWSN